MKFYPTHVLQILKSKKLLDNRLKLLFPQSHILISAFLSDVLYNREISTIEGISYYIPELLKHGLISKESYGKAGSPCSLLFVDAVNFELTYKCNHLCTHCLQTGLRRDPESQLITSRVKELIHQSFLMGLCQKGINFTGGEILGNRDDFFEIIEYTNSLNIKYRINTNSWWARRKGIKICNIHFHTAKELLIFLKARGLSLFAFSFDKRYNDMIPEAHDLLESIWLCEELQMPYQVIFTGIPQYKIIGHLDEIASHTGRNLEFIVPVSMEMVDIGGATELDSEVYRRQSNLSACGCKGFFRPTILHVSPYGDIRSCLYGTGMHNVGELRSKSFAEIINDFPGKYKNTIFADTSGLKKKYDTYVTPYLDMYKPIRHECTRNIILAKTLERLEHDKNGNLEEIHREISAEMSLSIHHMVKTR